MTDPTCRPSAPPATAERQPPKTEASATSDEAPCDRCGDIYLVAALVKIPNGDLECVDCVLEQEGLP